MKYVFDTNVVVVFLNGRSPVLRERIQTARPGDFAMCSVV
jgi:hypothetical protein